MTKNDLTKNKYQISFLQEEDYSSYRQFIRDHPLALYEHSLEIKDLISHHFKFEPMYLVAKEEALDKDKSKTKIAGVFPLFKAHSFIEGTRLVSLPFFPFGGVLGKDFLCKQALLRKAQELAQNVRFLEIRQREELDPELTENFVRQSPITDFLLPFRSTEEETFQSLDKRVRYDIKKAQKNNLQVKIGKTKKELDDFYSIYLNTKKKRGVPAWPYGLFAEALKTCNSLIGVVYHQNKPIASGFFFLHKNEIEYGFAGADYKFTHLSPYYMLLWEMVRYGIKNGYTILDFGGSTKELNEGNLYAFKERWCPLKREIPYYFYASDSNNVPQLQKSFKVYTWYGKVWSLLPKWFIKMISPAVIRQFS